MRKAILDTETTGLDFRTGDRVMESVRGAELMAEIAKESKGHCLWRDLESAPGMS